MDNKNEVTIGSVFVEFLMTYGWAILVAIIIVGTLAIYIRDEYREQFIIEKNECKNELWIYHRAIEVQTNNSDYTAELKKEFNRVVKEENIENPRLDLKNILIFINNQGFLVSGQIDFEANKQVCNSVEVDEIKICEKDKWDCAKFSVQDWNSCENPCLKIWKEERKESETSAETNLKTCINMCEDRMYTSICDVVSKQDITREKLEELGAECTDCGDCIFQKKSCECGKLKCTKWTLEEYTISLGERK
jgi:hypothetical protein